MANEDKSVVEYISEVDELLEVSKFIHSEQVDQALGTIVKIVSKPDIPPQTAAYMIVKLQAISSICAVQASYYKNLNPGKAGSEEYQRKNMYFSLHEAINELCQALKYLCKQ
jgi:hypothetical protein